MINLANKLGTPTTRRRMLINMSQAAGAVGLLGLGLGHYTKSQASLSASALRPPGALEEKDFLGACVRCGLCVRDCPYDTLSLAYLGDDAPTGTPFFKARKVPCEMCDDIPCVKACPTGALDPSLTNIDKARMGIAVLVDQETCLNFQGLRCDVCFRVCPLINKAITLEPRHSERTGKHAMFIPVVHSEQCTGCGKCEYACVLKEAAIKVLPQHLAKGQSDEHYQMGWKEKQKAGESLVTPDTQHQYNLPEGYQYEHAGRGLMTEKESAKQEAAND